MIISQLSIECILYNSNIFSDYSAKVFRFPNIHNNLGKVGTFSFVKGDSEFKQYVQSHAISDYLSSQSLCFFFYKISLP